MVQLRLVHPPDETVDLDLAVAGLATLDVMLALDVEAANGGGKLEGPEEVADLLEVGAAGDNLVDKILNADNAILTKALLNNGVAGERNTVALNLGEPTLVDELLDGLKVGVTVSNIGLNVLNHLHGGLVDPHKDTHVELPQAEKLKNLLGLGGNLVKTTNADNKNNLGLGLNIKAIVSTGLAAKTDKVRLLLTVLLNIVLGALEDFLAGSSGLHLGSDGSSGLLSGPLLIPLPLLGEKLRN
mmetsp:Transcript_19933/g.35876  ORF Transcript_19933/g.35876 Transcript_19933/m.35876 type:complete len:242 (-) Transcript_19933:81-806(-)